ncbi:MAG: type II toxin-antitoxin system RelE/ParE family toxin [Opitutales bacterium]
MKKIRISSDALSDLNEGFLFYEQQAQGLGDYYTSCLRADIEELKITGGSHRMVHRHFHRCLSRVFPYGIFYLFEEEIVVIYAVVDLRRDPEFIRRHLNKK